MTPGAWNHVVITFDGNVQKTYANGVKVGEFALDANIDDSSEPLYIGAWKGGSEFFNGKIDEVGIWNQALSEQQLSSLTTDFNGDIQAFNAPVPEPATVFCLALGLLLILRVSVLSHRWC